MNTNGGEQKIRKLDGSLLRSNLSERQRMLNNEILKINFCFPAKKLMRNIFSEKRG